MPMSTEGKVSDAAVTEVNPIIRASADAGSMPKKNGRTSDIPAIPPSPGRMPTTRPMNTPRERKKRCWPLNSSASAEKTMSMSKPPVLALGRAIILVAKTGDYPIGPSQTIFFGPGFLTRGFLTRAKNAITDRFAYTACSWMPLAQNRVRGCGSHFAAAICHCLFYIHSYTIISIRIQIAADGTGSFA